jgi:glycolate oxidase iron-sulfur subunit
MTVAPVHIRPDELSTCISCGLCLNDCPTYRVLGDEADSPRGRIALMRTLVDSSAPPDASLVGHLEACLVCRACETACPSGVPFGRLMEGAREIVRERAPESRRARMVRRLALGTISDPRRLGFVTGLTRLYQKSGVQRLARWLGVLPPMLRQAEGLLPESLDPPYALRDVPAAGRERHHVSFFAGCVMRTAFGETNRATVRVLARNGCRVSVPPDQICCGALHAHAGEGEGARALARTNIAAFERSAADVIVVNAAGCGAHLKGYGYLLRDDPAWRERAARFADRVRDVSEFLSDNLVATPRPLPGLTVAYQDACHLSHGQRVRAQPRALLRAVPGIKLVELGDGERCCGSAGVYNITQPELGAEFGRQKAEWVIRAAPDVVVSANPGCLIQIAAHLRAAGSPIRAMHIVRLLDQAYEKMDA